MTHNCGVCGSARHNDLLCPNTPFGRRARATLTCGYCGSRTHRRQACPKLVPATARPLDHFALDIVAKDHEPLRFVERPKGGPGRPRKGLILAPA